MGGVDFFATLKSILETGEGIEAREVPAPPPELEPWTESSVDRVKSFADLGPYFPAIFRIEVQPRGFRIVEAVIERERLTPRRSVIIEAKSGVKVPAVQVGQVARCDSPSVLRALGYQGVIGEHCALLSIGVSPTEQWWIVDDRPELFRKKMCGDIGRHILAEAL